ncbi:hypothetical protein FZC66_06360 [Priestia megaterium]|nr:hypothetical protein FZC66_06360 [Priestia megaterium]
MHSFLLILGGGNNEAIGALAYNRQQTTISRLVTYVIQLGTNTGAFEMAVLQPVSPTEATVIGVTTVVNALTPGLFILPLTTPVILDSDTVYALAVYNQINGSSLDGRSTGLGTVKAAFPINFRDQNLTGFTIGQSINTSDVSLFLSPWIAGLA